MKASVVAWVALAAVGVTLVGGGCKEKRSSRAQPTGQGQPLQCGDERSPLDTRSDPVVNGSNSWDPDVISFDAGRALAVGAVMRQGWGGGWDNFCTGTLVADRVFLTASHCVVDWHGNPESAASMRVGLGSNVAMPDALLSIDEVHVHPDYDVWGATAEHDVAILVLGESASAAAPSVRPVDVNCSSLSSASLEGEDVQVVGYGNTDVQGEVSTSRRYWAVEEVVDLSGDDFTVDGHGEQGVCYGDSGGPTLWTMPDGVVRVIGVLSWGDELCSYEDHFVRVDQECDFIGPFLSACGEVTEQGACEGDVYAVCVGDELVRTDCAAQGELCGESGGVLGCQPDPCVGETRAGRCDGDTAIYCDDEVLHTDDCAAAGASCARNGIGLYRCVAPADPCEGETAEGRCSGDVAVYCDDDGLVRDDCGAQGKVCDETVGGMRCVEAPDPCEGETLAGRCDAQVAVYCDGDQIVRADCAADGLVCGDDGSGAARCVASPDPCGEETFAGRCDGDVAIFCSEGEVTHLDCAAAQLSCGDTGEGSFRCVDLPDPCTGETLAGRCESGWAVYCEAESVVRADCAASDLECGSDGEGHLRCVEPAPACGDESYEGRCDGETAVFCVDAEVQRQDCAADGLVCGQSDDGLQRCVSPTVDPCDGETLSGRCDGDTAIFCVDGSVTRVDCTARTEHCGQTDDGIWRCVQPDPCDGETLEGRCDGDDAIWCEGGEVRIRRCADCEQSCGWSEGYGGYYCVD